MSVSSPIIANSPRPQTPPFENIHRFSKRNESLTTNELRSPQPSLEKFVPLALRVKDLDRNFFSSKKRTVKELSRAVAIASKSNCIKFEEFLISLLSIAELKVTYQNALNYLRIKNPDFFQTFPKITGFHQVSENVSIPILEWETVEFPIEQSEAASQLVNLLGCEVPLRGQFETIKEMEITFNYLRKFLVDPISVEVNRDFCVTRMLWVSFFLEKLIGIKCLECYLTRTGENFFLNRTNLDLESYLELEKYQTTALNEEETDLLEEYKDIPHLANQTQAEEKIFNWNFHAAVLVFCKEDPKPYVFDLIALKPIRFDHWDKIFNGVIVLRSDCKASNIFNVKATRSTTFDYSARDCQWRLDKEIQHSTLQAISASYQSALKGNPSKTIYLTRPFAL